MAAFAPEGMAAYIDGARPRLNLKSAAPGGLSARREIGMKFKMFSASGPDGIVTAVNAWLTPLTGIAIRHTETRFEVLDGREPLLLFSVWYDE